MAGGLKVGLIPLEVVADTLSGTGVFATNISGTTAALGASEIGTAEIGSGAILNVNLSGAQVSGTKVSPEFGPVGTGSPIAFGRMIQAGNGTTSAASGLWVVFGRAFAAAPVSVVCTSIGATANATQVIGSPILAGSFLATSETASQLFSWMAIGSGR